jgi:hypothetical protein
LFLLFMPERNMPFTGAERLDVLVDTGTIGAMLLTSKALLLVSLKAPAVGVIEGRESVRRDHIKITLLLFCI